MLEKQLYSQIRKSPKVSLTITILMILFSSGISLTFVIPGLKGFNLSLMIVTLLMYFVVANMFVGLLKGKIWFVFIGCLLLSSLGMGWRLWLEWGEYSLVQHMNPAVFVGYPIVIAILITATYSICSAIFENKSN